MPDLVVLVVCQARIKVNVIMDLVVQGPTFPTLDAGNLHDALMHRPRPLGGVRLLRCGLGIGASSNVGACRLLDWRHCLSPWWTRPFGTTPFPEMNPCCRNFRLKNADFQMSISVPVKSFQVIHLNFTFMLSPCCLPLPFSFSVSSRFRWP